MLRAFHFFPQDRVQVGAMCKGCDTLKHVVAIEFWSFPWPVILFFFFLRCIVLSLRVFTFVRPCYEMAVELTPVGLGVSVGTQFRVFVTIWKKHSAPICAIWKWHLVLYCLRSFWIFGFNIWPFSFLEGQLRTGESFGQDCTVHIRFETLHLNALLVLLGSSQPAEGTTKSVPRPWGQRQPDDRNRKHGPCRAWGGHQAGRTLAVASPHENTHDMPLARRICGRRKNNSVLSETS